MSERANMRQVREVLRLHDEGRTHRQISAATGLSKGAVCDYLRRAREAGLGWAEAKPLCDAEVETRLFKVVDPKPRPRAPVDPAWVHLELRRTGVTLQLLWNEYREAVVAKGEGLIPYGYTQFCAVYKQWGQRLTATMRQIHKAGEKCFVDYSGKKPSVVDAETGEVIEVELFVAVLGASSYTYAEATRSQKLGDFVDSVIRSYEFFGGVPSITVPDQLRSAVSGSDWYDPELNPTVAEMAAHYGTAIVPARPRKPRDKAKVEAAVLVVQRWILARLRNRTFFGLDALNEAIAELVTELNARPMQKMATTRAELFRTIDQPVLGPLPSGRYVKSQWRKAKVHPDYHVAFDERHYSVPCALIGRVVEVRATTRTVEILHGGERVASHARSFRPPGTLITVEEHRPKHHRDYGSWPPERMLSWAEKVGPSVVLVVKRMMSRYPRPEMAYRPVFALMRDAKTHGPERLDAACARALAICGEWGPTRRSIVNILQRRLENKPLHPAETRPQLSLPALEHVRGSDYFDKKEIAHVD